MSQSQDLLYFIKTAFCACTVSSILICSWNLFCPLILFKGEQEVCSSLPLRSWSSVLKNWVWKCFFLPKSHCSGIFVAGLLLATDVLTTCMKAILRWIINNIVNIHLATFLFTYNFISTHVFTANHIMHLPTPTLSIDQSNCSPGFLNFQLTKIYYLTLKMAFA